MYHYIYFYFNSRVESIFNNTYSNWPCFVRER